MITLLKKIFIENWQRKLVSLILAMIVWVVVNHSITSKNNERPTALSKDASLYDLIQPSDTPQ